MQELHPSVSKVSKIIGFDAMQTSLRFRKQNSSSLLLLTFGQSGADFPEYTR